MRQIVLPLLLLQAFVTAIALFVTLRQSQNMVNSAWVLGATALIWSALAAYWRGWEPARYAAIIVPAAFIIFLLPEPFLTSEFSISIFLPSVAALILGNASWVLLTGIMVHLSLLIRAGWSGIYTEPVGLALTIAIVGGMALGRSFADSMRKNAEGQARLIDQERALLAQRVAERTSELEAANAALVRAGQLKDAFLANISHELRTPLNMILGNLELLREGIYGELNERQDQSVESMADEGARLLQLIDDLLDLSGIEAGQLAFSYTEVPVREVCEQCISLARQQAIPRHQQVLFSLDPAVTTIRSDARRLRQILNNLLSNAVKFTPPGGVLGLDVRINGDDLELVVWDEGIGIAPERLELMFQPFTQADQGLARQYEGAGLGLALVRQLVALHGGHVQVTTTPGQGSRFTVRLPLAETFVKT